MIWVTLLLLVGNGRLSQQAFGLFQGCEDQFATDLAGRFGRDRGALLVTVNKIKCRAEGQILSCPILTAVVPRRNGLLPAILAKRGPTAELTDQQLFGNKHRRSGISRIVAACFQEMPNHLSVRGIQ